MNAEKISDYWRSILAERNYFESVGEYEKFKDAICHIAKKAHAINIYSIIRQHVLHLDFRKMKYNLDYTRDFGFFSDIKLMFQTVFEVAGS